jgi:heme/copper-type cytochrome/quinol oxidase subunit 1
LYGILAVPGFIAALVELLHLAKDVEFLRQHLGPLLVVAKQLFPNETNVPVLILGTAWATGFLFVAPRLAKSYGSGRSLCLVAISIIVAGFFLGALEGQKTIEEMNRQYKIKREHLKIAK